MFLNAFRRLFINSQNRKARRTSGSPRLELLSLENRITPTTFTVNTTADTVDSDPNVTSLREAITLANTTPGNDQISFNLTGSSPYTITLAGVLPTILDAAATASGTGGTGTTVGTLTINGPGSSSLIISGLDNGNTNRNFNIFSIASGGNLSISGVTVSGAKTTGFGGAFKNSGILNISTSVISGNTSTSDGGAVGNYGGGTLNIANSTLSDNSASQGGAVANGGTTTISNSTLSSNRSAARGGAIVNNGNFTVTNSTISGNSSLFSGGGIENNSGTLSLSNSTIFANSAVTYGGGIFNGATLTVTNSTLSNNSAAALINSVSGGGGIFNRSGSTLNIANTIIANSTSGLDYAGGGNVNLISSGNGSDPTVPANNIVTQVTSSATSAWAQSVTSAQLNLGPLQNNGGPTQTLALLSGSVAIGAGNATISNNPIYANGKDQRGINRTTSDIGAYSFGIQVINTSDNLNSPSVGSLRAAINLANTTPGNDQISFNLTGASSYTITLAGALPTILDAAATASGTGGTGTTVGTVTITGLGASLLTISGDNGVSGRNFRIFNIASGGNLSISGVTVSGANISSGNGGGFNNSGTLNITNSTISGNVVSGIGANNSGLGGGIFNNTNGTLTVNNSLISGNTATNGGGIYNRATLSLSNSTISGNHALASNSGSITSRYIYAGNGGALHS